MTQNSSNDLNRQNNVTTGQKQQGKEGPPKTTAASVTQATVTEDNSKANETSGTQIDRSQD